MALVMVMDVVVAIASLSTNGAIAVALVSTTVVAIMVAIAPTAAPWATSAAAISEATLTTDVWLSVGTLMVFVAWQLVSPSAAANAMLPKKHRAIKLPAVRRTGCKLEQEQE